DARYIVSQSPLWIMQGEFAHVADPPHVIADAVGLAVAPAQRPAGDFLAAANRFEHRAVAEPPAAHVVNLARPWRQKELLKRPDQVGAVDVVAYLLAAVAEDGVRRARDGAFHQVREKAV